MDSVVCFVCICPLDSDLSGGKRYPPFEQLGPGVSTPFYNPFKSLQKIGRHDRLISVFQRKKGYIITASKVLSAITA